MYEKMTDVDYQTRWDGYNNIIHEAKKMGVPLDDKNCIMPSQNYKNDLADLLLCGLNEFNRTKRTGHYNPSLKYQDLLKFMEYKKRYRTRMMSPVTHDFLKYLRNKEVFFIH